MRGIITDCPPGGESARARLVRQPDWRVIDSAASGGLLVRSMQDDQISVPDIMVRQVMRAMCLSTLLAGACVDAPGGVSDVPCTVISEWGHATVIFRGDGESLLITEDSNKDFHEVILRFDPSSASFISATQMEWNQAGGEIQRCCLLVGEEGGFSHSGGVLTFEGELIPVSGGRVVNMSPSISRNKIAVLSTDGNVTMFNASSGQHYHQSFEVNSGQQMGAALRMVVGGRENGGVLFDWSQDERFVVYHNTVNLVNPMGRRVCVVDERRVAHE